MNWDIDSAIHEVMNGDPKTGQFKAAVEWLEALINEYSPKGGLLVGAVALELLDKIAEHREDE